MEKVNAAHGDRVRAADLWQLLDWRGRLLMLAVVVDALGTGMLAPFYVVYYRDALELPLAHIGLLVALTEVPQVVGTRSCAFGV